jgi:multidrug resistance protein
VLRCKQAAALRLIRTGYVIGGVRGSVSTNTGTMGVSEMDKDVSVATSSGREKVASTSSTSHSSEKSRVIEDIETEDDDHTSVSSDSDSIHSRAPSRPSIHHTWSRNSGHSWPGHKDLGITTVTTNATSDPRFELDFDDNGENPQDWTMAKKSLVIFFMSFSTLVVVMYSTSYTSGIPGMMETFGIRSKTLVILGITTYLCGLAIGSLLLAPLSEMYGRRPVYLIAVAAFTILIIPCALSNNLPQILVMRFFGAIAGAAMISNAPGTVSDIVSDDYRALAFSIWSLGPMNGPVVGPLVGGFVFQALGWRWTNWVVMIGSGVSWFMVFRTYSASHFILTCTFLRYCSHQRDLRPRHPARQIREKAQRNERLALAFTVR